ncbi:MAG TPA: biotin transporter BioY [Dehalococcoidia bacterium]|nr:biotin transporter BioY [Dehalococcoidia bacterium]
MAVSTWSRWQMARYNAYRWRYELILTKKIALALGMACVVGLAAQLRFPLPWTPVPITGQTFAVLLAGVLLGRWWGGISLTIYVGLGAAGLPWFNGGTGGVGILAGPTGGYIIGFILTALFLGHFTDKYIRSRSFFSMLGLMLFANIVLIYIPGLLQLHLWLRLVGGEAIGFYQVLAMGFLPFIIGDIVKAVAAAAITRGITPKKAYNGEVDKDKWASWRIP